MCWTQIAAGGGRYRGIRVAAPATMTPAVPGHRTNPPPHLFEQADFRAGFKHLAPRNLSFELWPYHPQIPDATSLARAFPETTLVLNHFGGPIGVGSYAGKGDEVFAQWKRDIEELAQCQNVVAKLGGIAMEVNGLRAGTSKPKPPASEELMEATRHYYEYTIEHFTPQRCMFESNFPARQAQRQLCHRLELFQASHARLFSLRPCRALPRHRRTRLSFIA